MIIYKIAFMLYNISTMSDSIYATNEAGICTVDLAFGEMCYRTDSLFFAFATKQKNPGVLTPNLKEAQWLRWSPTRYQSNDTVTPVQRMVVLFYFLEFYHSTIKEIHPLGNCRGGVFYNVQDNGQFQML